MGTVVGLSARAYNMFDKKQDIPQCTGWSRELNKEFMLVIKDLVRQVAVWGPWHDNLQLDNLDQKGIMLLIMWQQFKWAIGVMGIQGNAMYKLSGLHYMQTAAAQRRRLW